MCNCEDFQSQICSYVPSNSNATTAPGASATSGSFRAAALVCTGADNDPFPCLTFPNLVLMKTNVGMVLEDNSRDASAEIDDVDGDEGDDGETGACAADVCLRVHTLTTSLPTLSELCVGTPT